MKEAGEIVRNMDKEKIFMLKVIDSSVNMTMDCQMVMENIIGQMAVFTEVTLRKDINTGKESCSESICRIKQKSGCYMKESLLMMLDMGWVKLNGLMATIILDNFKMMRDTVKVK
jgi:hypothetical protein